MNIKKHLNGFKINLFSRGNIFIISLIFLIPIFIIMSYSARLDNNIQRSQLYGQQQNSDGLQDGKTSSYVPSRYVPSRKVRIATRNKIISGIPVTSSIPSNPRENYWRIYGNGLAKRGFNNNGKARKISIIYYYASNHYENKTNESIDVRLGWVFNPNNELSMWKMEPFNKYQDLVDVYVKRLKANINSYSAAKEEVKNLIRTDIVARNIRNKYKKVVVILESPLRPSGGSYISGGIVRTSIKSARSKNHYVYVIVHETFGHGFVGLKDDYPRTANWKGNRTSKNITKTSNIAQKQWKYIRGFNSGKIEKRNNFWRYEGYSVRKGYGLMSGEAHGSSPAQRQKYLSLIERYYTDEYFKNL